MLRHPNQWRTRTDQRDWHCLCQLSSDTTPKRMALTLQWRKKTLLRVMPIRLCESHFMCALTSIPHLREASHIFHNKLSFFCGFRVNSFCQQIWFRFLMTDTDFQSSGFFFDYRYRFLVVRIYFFITYRFMVLQIFFWLQIQILTFPELTLWCFPFGRSFGKFKPGKGKWAWTRRTSYGSVCFTKASMFWKGGRNFQTWELKRDSANMLFDASEST